MEAAVRIVRPRAAGGPSMPRSPSVPIIHLFCVCKAQQWASWDCPKTICVSL